jgi:hypothetical protein
MKTLQILPAMALLALSVTVMPALAHTEKFSVILTGAAESPPQTTGGIGVGFITFDLDLLTMEVDVNFAGLTGNVTASHIHCCTAVAGAGTAGVATPTPTFPAFPLGATFGSYDRVFDMTQASSYNAAFVTAQGSVGNALNALILGAENGKAYLNIHTTFAPGGEIRGFLVAVPEPSTYGLMLAGIGAVATVVRRRKQVA